MFLESFVILKIQVRCLKVLLAALRPDVILHNIALHNITGAMIVTRPGDADMHWPKNLMYAAIF